jgi:peptidyl-prolyl cis-trans isomerase B (cyclophilin B)
MAKPKEKSAIKEPSAKTRTNLYNSIFSIISLIVLGGGFLYYSYNFFPKVLDQTEDAKSKQQVKDLETRKNNEDQRKKDRQAQLVTQDPADLKFDGVAADMKTNFGSLLIDLKYNAAPKTVESFVRLTSRNYFNKIDFHRYVKGDNFTVIQGGDPTGTSSGGESAFGTPLPDEIWKTAPIKATDGTGKITNDPEFTDSSLYSNFSKDTGTATYRKGLIIMANSGPDSGGSQFFITLSDTVLPAAYTTFGVIRPESFATLDKINKEVGVIVKNQGTQGYQSTTQDGQPDKELYIDTVKII